MALDLYPTCDKGKEKHANQKGTAQPTDKQRGIAHPIGEHKKNCLPKANEETLHGIHTCRGCRRWQCSRPFRYIAPTPHFTPEISPTCIAPQVAMGCRRWQCSRPLRYLAPTPHFIPEMSPTCIAPQVAWGAAGGMGCRRWPGHLILLAPDSSCSKPRAHPGGKSAVKV